MPPLQPPPRRRPTPGARPRAPWGLRVQARDVDSPSRFTRLVVRAWRSARVRYHRANALSETRNSETLRSNRENSWFATPRSASPAIRLRLVIGRGDFAREAANETLAASIRRNARVLETPNGGFGVSVFPALKAPTTREQDRHERDVRLKRRWSARSDTHAPPRLSARARYARVVDCGR